MKVRGNHPLAEIIAKKLIGIQNVPPLEADEMINRACKVAVEYHEQSLNQASQEDREGLTKIFWSELEKDNYFSVENYAITKEFVEKVFEAILKEYILVKR